MGCISSKRQHRNAIEDYDAKKAEYDEMVQIATNEKFCILERKAADEKYWDDVVNESRGEDFQGEDEFKLDDKLGRFSLKQNEVPDFDMRDKLDTLQMDDIMHQRILDCIRRAGSCATFRPLSSQFTNIRSPNKLLYAGDMPRSTASFGSMAFPLVSFELQRNPVSGVVREPVTGQPLMVVIREPVAEFPESISTLLGKRKGPAALLHAAGMVVGALYSQPLPQSVTRGHEWGAKAYALDVRTAPGQGVANAVIPLVIYEWWRGKGEPMLLGVFIRNPDGSRGSEIAMHKTDHDREQTSWMNSSLMEIYEGCPADPLAILILAWFLFYTEVPAFPVARTGMQGRPPSPVLTPVSSTRSSLSLSASAFSSPRSSSQPLSSSEILSSPVYHHLSDRSFSGSISEEERA